MTFSSEQPLTVLGVSLGSVTKFFIKELKLDEETAKNAATVLLKYIDEEDYSSDSIIEDLNEGYDGSALVDFVAETLNWSTEKLQQSIHSTLYQLFQLPASILSLNWNVSEKDTIAVRKYMQKQCPNLIKDGENEDMIYIMAVGRNNDMNNLLCLLYDAFTKYRSDNRTNADGNKNHIQKNSTHFVEETILSEIPSEATRKSIAMAMKAFEHRLIPGFKFKSPKIYNDKCEAFVEYTLSVARTIRNVINTAYFDKTACLPLQVDLIIIPHKIDPPANNMYGTGSDEDDSDDDDDGEEENESKTENVDKTADDLKEVFERVMGQEYIKKEISYAVDQNSNGKTDQSFWRELTDILKDYIGGKQCQRISIVIDRRTEPNTIYVYTLPDGKNEFPTDYCLTTLVNRSAKFVIPVWDETIAKAEKFPFVGGGHTPGNFFQVSYQVLNEDRTRIQWNFIGNGIRLTPEMMINVWPTVFVDSALSKKYTEKYIKEQLALSDPWFDSWEKQFKKEK